MDHAAAIAELRVCDNCETELSGEYCQNCGQKALHHDSWALSHFFHELWHETIHLDSKIFKTLKLLLFQPGELTRLYLSGQRQPFVNPIRLYLAITALFFFFGAQTDFNIEGFQRSGNAAGLTTLVQKMAENHNAPYEIELQQFNQGFHKKFSILIAFGVLAFAYAVHLMYRKKEIWYGKSLIFAIHFYCLFFVILLVWRLALHYLDQTGLQTPMQGFHFVILIFLALSVRRVWPERARSFIPKLLFLWFNAILVYSLAIALGIGLQIFVYGRVVREVINGK